MPEECRVGAAICNFIKKLQPRIHMQDMYL